MKNLKTADCCYTCKHMIKREYPYEETIFYCNADKTIPKQLSFIDSILGNWQIEHEVESYNICDLFERRKELTNV